MATIKDVAEYAGTSVSTVSRYLNNHPYISEKNRLKIKEAMDVLDYTPNGVATQLRSKKGSMIGILVSRITNPFFSYLVDAIEREAKAMGYNVLMMQTYDDQHAEFKMLELLKQKIINGLIMCSVESDAHKLDSYRKYGPIVLCNETLSGTDIPQIVTRQEEAAYNAISYLINAGYRKIAYCTGGSLMAKGHGSSRTKGVERALFDAKVSMKREWIFKEIHSIDDGRKVAHKILDMPKTLKPDAIFANSDEVASGIIDVLVDANKEIPQYLAVMGFDNQPYSSMLKVPLTTIAQPVGDLGKEAVHVMVAALEDKQYQIDSSKLELKFIKRKSA